MISSDGPSIGRDSKGKIVAVITIVCHKHRHGVRELLRRIQRLPAAPTDHQTNHNSHIKDDSDWEWDHGDITEQRRKMPVES